MLKKPLIYWSLRKAVNKHGDYYDFENSEEVADDFL